MSRRLNGLTHLLSSSRHFRSSMTCFQPSSPNRSLLTSRVLVPLMMAVLAVWGMLRPSSVSAQTAVQPAVVLDFSVKIGDDPILGRKAADSLAVELQRSGDYEVVTRQQVEDAIATQPGLRPPYNEPTQQRLAGAVEARTVFSGRVVGVSLTNHRSARIQIEVRQLDAATGDYINGTQISEITSDKLQDVDNDVLIDEAINKASFDAVRAMKQTRLPEGTVLNVTKEDMELNIGSRNGGVAGQRYSVLRDVFNRSRNIVERVKVGEVTITHVDADQSTAVLSAGGQSGVRTGDHIRQIFVPSTIAFVASETGSTSPVTAPPAVTRSGTPKAIKKTGAGLIGVVALGLLVGLAGFGGGSSNTATEAPKSITAVPVNATASTTATAAININFKEGIPNVLRSSDAVAGYMVFRSTSANFAATPETLIAFLRGSQTNYTDTSTGDPRHQVTISEDTPTTGTTGSTQVPSLTIEDNIFTTAAPNNISQTSTEVTLVFTRSGAVPGVQYFYRVVRIYAQRTTTTDTGTGTGTGTGTTTTTINLQPVLSNASNPSGGATSIPVIPAENIETNNNLDSLSVTLRAFTNSAAVPGDINQITVQISKSPSFPSATTFEQVISTPAANTAGDITFNLGDITVRDFTSGDNVYLRVGLRNTTDSPGAIIYSRPLLLTSPTSSASLASRFVSKEGTGLRSGGIGLPGSAGGGLGRSGVTRTPSHVLRPR